MIYWDMRLELSAAVLILNLTAVCNAAPPVELELATERGVQITAPHEWLQLLTSVGIDDVRIRASRAGDEPQVVNRGTNERPRYHVVGILTARHELRLPGGTFTRSSRAALEDYFERLSADGGESLTEPRGLFGLTEDEMAAVLAALSQPINFETKGRPLTDVLDRLQKTSTVPLVMDPTAERLITAAKPVADELNGITAGTGLAMILRSCGLVIRPEKRSGEPVALHVLAAQPDDIHESTVGKSQSAGNDLKQWPIGWEPDRPPGELAPSLFEYRNAEIEGYTLEETLAAIGPRVKVPMFLDHRALAAAQIDPAKIQVRLARTRSLYKRIIDRVLSQARLGSDVRVDEAGTPFLWITR